MKRLTLALALVLAAGPAFADNLSSAFVAPKPDAATAHAAEAAKTYTPPPPPTGAQTSGPLADAALRRCQKINRVCYLKPSIGVVMEPK